MGLPSHCVLHSCQPQICWAETSLVSAQAKYDTLPARRPCFVRLSVTKRHPIYYNRKQHFRGRIWRFWRDLLKYLHQQSVIKLHKAATALKIGLVKISVSCWNTLGVHGLQSKHCCKPCIPFMAVASPSRTSAHCENCSGTAQAIQQTCSPNSRGPGGTSVGSARTSLHHATYISFLIFGWSEPL